MINKVILVGNLTADAENLSKTGTAFTKMRIATNQTWRDSDGNRQESSEFHSVIAFGKLAEICTEYAQKGRRVYVEGKLRTREYTGNDGLKRYSTEIVADTVRMLDSKNDSAKNGRETAISVSELAPVVAIPA